MATPLRDPMGLIEAALPFDRAPHEALITAVLAWTAPGLPPRDYEQIALQLTGHARGVAADVARRAARLPPDDGRRILAEVVLGEASHRLSVPVKGAAGVQGRAHLLRALYERLDGLAGSR
jgi:hypothetical protein